MRKGWKAGRLKRCSVDGREGAMGSNCPTARFADTPDRRGGAPAGFIGGRR